MRKRPDCESSLRNPQRTSPLGREGWISVGALEAFREREIRTLPVFSSLKSRPARLAN